VVGKSSGQCMVCLPTPPHHTPCLGINSLGHSNQLLPISVVRIAVETPLPLVFGHGDTNQDTNHQKKKAPGGSSCKNGHHWPPTPPNQPHTTTATLWNPPGVKELHRVTPGAKCHGLVSVPVCVHGLCPGLCPTGWFVSWFVSQLIRHVPQV
jgi:hypothetical protein